MSFSTVNIYENELENVGKIEYEICADNFLVEIDHPAPENWSDIVLCEEQHSLSIKYPQQFIRGRPVSGQKRLRVTIELLDGDSEA